MENASPEAKLIEAKIRFMKAADKIQPLGIVRKHPAISLGCAFLAGFGADRAATRPLLLSFLPNALAIAQKLFFK